MNRTLAFILVFGMLASVGYLHKRLNTVDEQLRQIAAQSHTCEKSQTMKTEDASEVTSRSQSQLAVPSRNPSADITGSSARVFQSKARQTDCRRACRFLADCLPMKNLCPTVQTDGTRAAAERCYTECKNEQAVKAELLDITGCPQTLPSALSFICPKSP